MFRAMRAMMADPSGKVLLGAAIATVLVGTLVYSILEDWSLVDALYFSVVTLTTIGYGDLHPTTDASRLFTILYILSGLGIVTLFVTELAGHSAMARRAGYTPKPRLTGSEAMDPDRDPEGPAD
jgi:voltage-gated potassium channel